MTLTFSWYGFNASIHRNPVLYGSFAGMMRFFLDAFLIVCYGFILVMFEQFGIVFFTLVVIFGLYTFWDGLKVVEYRMEPWMPISEGDDIVEEGDISHWRWYLRKIWDRHSLKYFVILAAAFIVYLVNRWFLGISELDWVFLAILFIATFTYRLQKMDWTIHGDPNDLEEIVTND